MKKPFGLLKGEKGQAIVEAAFVLPLLLIFLCMIIDVGRIVYAESRLNMLCQEAVRIAGLGGGDAEIQNFAFNRLDPDTADTLSVTVSPAEALRDSGDYVTVNLSVDLDYITPFAKTILPSPLNITAESTIRVE